MTLGAIIFCQIGMVMNIRTSDQSIRKLSLFGNSLINIGLVVELAIFILLVYVPIFHNLFNTASFGCVALDLSYTLPICHRWFRRNS